MNPQIERELKEAAERFDILPEIEKQKREWDRGIRNPELMRKAEAIIASLNGEKFSIDELSEKHFDIYVLYLSEAARGQGYHLLDPLQYTGFIYEK